MKPGTRYYVRKGAYAAIQAKLQRGRATTGEIKTELAQQGYSADSAWWYLSKLVNARRVARIGIIKRGQGRPAILYEEVVNKGAYG